METQSSSPTLAAASGTPLIAPTLQPLTYSVNEAAQVLGVSPVTIYRLLARRLLRPLPCLRHKRIPKRQVEAYLNGAHSLD